MNDVLITFLIAFGVSALLSFPILKGLISLNSRQTVSKFVTEHAHKQGTPTMGGLIILVGAWAAIAYWTVVAGVDQTASVIAITAGYSLIGFVDDFVLPRVKAGSRGLGWIPKLVLQIAFAAVALFLAPDPTVRSNPLYFGMAVFLVLFYANAYNFSDGLDWLSGTIFIALGAGLTACTLFLGLSNWIFPLTAFLGGILPFLYLNRPPAKVFMGDVGSMAIGGLVGLVFVDLALVGSQQIAGSYRILYWTGLILVSVIMIVELVPVPLQILSVKLRKKRLFPFTPIHHAFQRAGWSEIKIVGLFFFVQLAGSIIGFLLVSRAGQ
jgi:phospho-N-acetylmuramoyl-pentapeptide-transferase